MAGRPRLKKGEIHIQDVLLLSKIVYKKENIDNKRRRMTLDVLSGKVTLRSNLSYDKSSRTWKQTGRDVRLEFMVKSDPVSYKKTDTVKIHKYPVIFLIHEWDKGIKSPFRWRTGGLHKWKNPPRKLRDAKDEKQKKQWKKENQKAIDLNIKRGLQGNFIFHLMWVLDKYGLLFGPQTCKPSAPNITNPTYTPYFDKTAYFIVSQVLPKLFGNRRIGALLRKTQK